MINTSEAVKKITAVIPKGEVLSTMDRSGLTQRCIYSWRSGVKSAGLDNLIVFANAAGVEIVLVKKDDMGSIRDFVL